MAPRIDPLATCALLVSWPMGRDDERLGRLVSLVDGELSAVAARVRELLAAEGEPRARAHVSAAVQLGADREV